MAEHMRTELVLDALNMAVTARGGNTNVTGVVTHADRGTQYTSNNYIDYCLARQMRHSVGRTGVCPPDYTAPSTTLHPPSGNSSTVKLHNHPSARRGDAQPARTLNMAPCRPGKGPPTTPVEPRKATEDEPERPPPHGRASPPALTCYPRNWRTFHQRADRPSSTQRVVDTDNDTRRTRSRNLRSSIAAGYSPPTGTGLTLVYSTKTER